MLMLDQDGRVVSVISGNLFAVVSGTIVTPPLLAGGVMGTRRQLLIDSWAPALGFDVEERAIRLAELEHADEIFYTNALVGLRPIARLADCSWEKHSVCEQLHGHYCGENF